MNDNYTIQFYPMAGHRPNTGQILRMLDRLTVGDTLTVVTSDKPYLQTIRRAAYHHRGLHSDVEYEVTFEGLTAVIKRIQPITIG